MNAWTAGDWAEFFIPWVMAAAAFVAGYVTRWSGDAGRRDQPCAWWKDAKPYREGERG